MSDTRPAAPFPSDLREQVARIIDPGAWRVMDGYLAEMLRKYKGEKVGYDPEAFKHKGSLAIADSILALISPSAVPGGETENRPETGEEGYADLAAGERVWLRATVVDPGSTPNDKYGRNPLLRLDGPSRQEVVAFKGEIERWPTGRLYSWGSTFGCAGCAAKKVATPSPALPAGVRLGGGGKTLVRSLAALTRSPRFPVPINLDCDLKERCFALLPRHRV